jgi:hypothetical protein
LTKKKPSKQKRRRKKPSQILDVSYVEGRIMLGNVLREKNWMSFWLMKVNLKRQSCTSTQYVCWIGIRAQSILFWGLGPRVNAIRQHGVDLRETLSSRNCSRSCGRKRKTIHERKACIRSRNGWEGCGAVCELLRQMWVVSSKILRARSLFWRRQ